MDDTEPFACETAGGEDALEPVESADVLGEDDHPLVVPLSSRTADAIELGDQRNGFTVSRLGMAPALPGHARK